MSRELGSTLVTSRSPIRMRPPLTGSRPASMRRDVDLPQPEGPTRTRNSPSPISRSSWSTAGLVAPSYMRVALSKVTVVMRFPSTGRYVPDDPSGRAGQEQGPHGLTDAAGPPCLAFTESPCVAGGFGPRRYFVPAAVVLSGE